MNAVLTVQLPFVRKMPPILQQVAPARKKRAERGDGEERLLHKDTRPLLHNRRAIIHNNKRIHALCMCVYSMYSHTASSHPHNHNYTGRVNYVT